MAEIAERAGVALSTVSYVLSGKRSVSQKMRERVLAAIEELDYRPHGPARALASGASHTIALFLPSPQWQLVPVQQTFVAAATQATSASDYALLLSTAPADPETIARLVAGGRADGVILMETLQDDPRIERVRADGHPFTLIGRTRDMTGISYVDMDFGDAVETSLAHLARLGHTCVALFNFPPDLLEAGYMSALIARDVFERRAPDFGIRGIQVPCSHAPARGVRGRGAAAALGACVHGCDHDRLAVHCAAQRAAGGEPPRPGRLLGRVGDRGPVRRDVVALAHRDRVAGLRSGQDGGGDADRAAHGAERPASPAPVRRGARRQGVDRTGSSRAVRGQTDANAPRARRRMKIAVTGGSGKAGRPVVLDLLEHGHEVLNVDRVPSPESSSPDSPAPLLVADLTDFGQTLEALSGGERLPGIEAVVHFAAIPSPVHATPDVVFRTNAVSTHTVFSAAARLGLRRVVWASSETTLGLPFDEPPDYVPVDEEHTLRPESSYALSKVLGEEMARQFSRWSGIPFVGLRFSNVMLQADYERFPSFWDDPHLRKWNLWSYVDESHVAESVRRALVADVRGADAFVIAAADSVMKQPSRDLMAEVFPNVPIRDGVSGNDTLLAIDKARRVLGYDPAFSWRTIL